MAEKRENKHVEFYSAGSVIITVSFCFTSLRQSAYTTQW